MNSKPLSVKNNAESQGATVLGPGDFPIGSPESRAAARFRLQGIGETGEGSRDCICFPEDEQPFFCSVAEEQVAARVKCPLHGDRFKAPHFYLYVARWYREKEPLRICQKSSQYQKAWAAGFPPNLWPAEEVQVGGKVMLRLKDGTLLTVE